MGHTSVDASLDRPHVLFCKEVENLVKVLLLCHGGKSPEAEAHVAQHRGQVVVNNHTIADSLWLHGWNGPKGHNMGKGP